MDAKIDEIKPSTKDGQPLSPHTTSPETSFDQFRPAEVNLHAVIRAEWREGTTYKLPTVGDVVTATVKNELEFGEVPKGSILTGPIEAIKIDGGYYADDCRRYHCYKIDGQWIFEAQIDFEFAEILETANRNPNEPFKLTEPLKLDVIYPEHIDATHAFRRSIRAYDLVKLTIDESVQQNLGLNSPIIDGQVVAILCDSERRGEHQNGNIYYIGSSYAPDSLIAIPEEAIKFNESQIVWPSMNGAALGDEITVKTTGGQSLSNRVTNFDFYSKGRDRIAIGSTSYPSEQIRWETLRVTTPFHPFRDQSLVQGDF